MTMRCLLFLLLLGMLAGRADILPEGTGFMYDENYWFEMKAPKGWVLDNQTVKSKQVCAVFYPVGTTWADGKVVFYVNTRMKKGEASEAIAAAIKADMDDLHKSGSPKAKAEKMKELKLAGGRVAELWEYTGDKWGNDEVTAFIVEKEGVSAVVLSARAKAEMEGALPSFEELVRSYKYMGKATIKK